MIFWLRCVILVMGLSGNVTGAALSFPAQSPEGRSTAKQEALRILADEDAELDYLYSVREVDEAEYQLTKGRHWVLRQYLRSLPDKLLDLPEVHVITREEAESLFEQLPDFSRLKVGNTWEGHWLYRGKMVRGRTFYIFERREQPPA